MAGAKKSRLHKSQYIKGEVEEQLYRFFLDNFSPKFEDLRVENKRHRKVILWMMLTCIRELREDGGSDIVPKYFYNRMTTIWRDEIELQSEL